MIIGDIVAWKKPWVRLKISNLSQTDVRGKRIWTQTLTEAQMYAYWSREVLNTFIDEESGIVHCILEDRDIAPGKYGGKGERMQKREKENCTGCRHDLGGGRENCRINAEYECREGGGFELFEGDKSDNVVAFAEDTEDDFKH